jgi:hypothetical protein
LSWKKKGVMLSTAQELNDRITLTIVTLPIDATSGWKRHRGRKGTQRLLPLKIEIEFEVREHEFPGGAKYRISISEPREVRFGDRPPTPAPAERAEDVVIISSGAKVYQPRLQSTPLERGSSQKGPIEAVRPTISERCSRREVPILTSVWKAV